jgi:hypothetical protein
VDSYLCREASEPFPVRQIVMINRAGTIRAQSGATGNRNRRTKTICI